MVRRILPTAITYGRFLVQSSKVPRMEAVRRGPPVPEPRMTTPFPKTPTFMTIDEPFRFEGECFDLEVEGKIPPELDGTFFRVGQIGRAHV